MADQTQDTGAANGNGTTPPATETVTVEQLQTVISGKDKLIEEIKRAQSGSDAAVTAQKKDLDELRNLLKEKMTDAEKKELESKEKTNELSTIKTELEDMRAENKRDKLDVYKSKKMAEVKLDAEFADFITGTTTEEMDAAIDKFKKNLDEKFKSIKSEAMDTGNPPGGKDTPAGGTIKRADFTNLSPEGKAEAMKAGTKITE